MPDTIFPVSTWTTVAGAVGQRLVDSFDTYPAGGQGGPDGTLAYSGIFFDLYRSEVIVALDGGHGDGADNASYVCGLRAATPAWRNLTRRTPDAAMPSVPGNTPVGSGTNGQTGYRYTGDSIGYPKPAHNTNGCWADGRVWWPSSSFFTSGQGASAQQIISFDRDAVGNIVTPLPYGQAPAGHSSSLTGPFTLWGLNPWGNDVGNGGTTVWDRYAHQIIGIWGNAQGSAGAIIWCRIPTMGPNIGVSTTYGANPGYVQPWFAACAYDLRIVVIGDGAYGRVMWLDLNPLNTATYNTWTIVPGGQVTGAGSPINSGVPGYFPWTTNTTPTFGQATSAAYCRAHYIARNRCIAIVDPYRISGQIYKLTIPTKLDTYGRVVFDPAGTFVSSVITPSGPTNTPPTAANYHSASGGDTLPCKSFLVEDMGDGRSAIGVVTSVSSPIFIYKIPAAGL